LLAQWMPHKVLSLYDHHVNSMRDMCKNTAVNPTIKTNLRSWLLRTRRMYYAAGQADAWEKRSVLVEEQRAGGLGFRV
jgi:hypothetical protein